MKPKREDVLMQKIDDLAQKVDEVRVTTLPQMKLDMQTAIADIKLHVEKTVNPIRIDVGGLKAKAALMGAMSGIIGTGLMTYIISLFGHR